MPNCGSPKRSGLTSHRRFDAALAEFGTREMAGDEWGCSERSLISAFGHCLRSLWSPSPRCVLAGRIGVAAVRDGAALWLMVRNGGALLRSRLQHRRPSGVDRGGFAYIRKCCLYCRCWPDEYAYGSASGFGFLETTAALVIFGVIATDIGAYCRALNRRSQNCSPHRAPPKHGPALLVVGN